MRNNLNKLRKLQKYTQEDLAKSLEVSRQTIISIENGKYNPSLQLAFKISKIFNKPIEEIFIYEDYSKKIIKPF